MSTRPHPFEVSSDRRGEGRDRDCGVARRELIGAGLNEGDRWERSAYGRFEEQERREGTNVAPPSSRTPGLAFFPSFEAFVPALSKTTTRDEGRAQGWIKSGRHQGEDAVGLGIRFEDDGGADSGTSRFSFSPFDASPVSSSFTFHPCPSFGSIDSAPSPPSLAPDNYAPSTGTRSFSLPLTRPRSRTSSLSHFLTPHAPPTILPPRPPHRRLPFLDSLPPSFIPSHSPPSPPSPIEQPYPLTAADTASIAALHGGRIPLLGQLAPAEAGVNDAATPIINTGNSGPMVVQAGDWKCEECGFQNWRRRKICMRCFPFANDIGSMLTIKSQRAATLATPPIASSHLPPLPSTYFSPSYSYIPPHPIFTFNNLHSFPNSTTSFHSNKPHAFPAPFSHVPFAAPLADLSNLVEQDFMPSCFEKKQWGEGRGMQGEGRTQGEGRGGTRGVVIFPAMGAGRS